MGVFFAALAALLFGSADFAGGVATRRNSVYAVLLLSQAVGLMLALVAAPLIGAVTGAAGAAVTGGAAGAVSAGAAGVAGVAGAVTGAGAAETMRAVAATTGVVVSSADMLWGAAAGLAGALGMSFLYKGLARGVIAVVSPLAAVVGAAVPVLGGAFLGELPGLLGQIGIAVSIPAIFLLGWEPVGTRDRAEVALSVRYGAIAGLCFGVFFIFISRPSAVAGMWPLVAARAATLPVLLFLIVAGRQPIGVARTGMSAVILAGAFDMSANISFVLASHYGLLSVAAVITSLAPAPTVILGRVFLGQRLTRSRILGLALAVFGVVLLSI